MFYLCCEQSRRFAISVIPTSHCTGHITEMRGYEIFGDQDSGPDNDMSKNDRLTDNGCGFLALGTTHQNKLENPNKGFFFPAKRKRSETVLFTPRI
ncbi:hypothetical protein Y032_0037g3372 [Ancylostoma ceylanicum]|uniref:Uncharacterized protein n=1 Tax=Ancylostoma ceylanicum TaxID=53326 RepID=A0A016UJV5_9BILA|nr:hypothetical protein Y032_0037g3372 [Ancylostoma ceylanicum]